MSKKTKGNGNKAQEKKDAYVKNFADTIIKKLEDHDAPWQKPWVDDMAEMPINACTNKHYRGSNILWLWLQGHSDPRWMTYKQAQSMGMQVREGEKGTQIVYWKFLERKETKEDAVSGEQYEEVKRFPFMRLSTVFHASQIDGMPEWAPEPTKPVANWRRHKRAESLLRKSKASIHHDQTTRAFYRPSTDSIHMPKMTQFPEKGGYYGTIIHELSHWTGHETRLNRDLTGFNGRTKDDYAREELRAEIATWMLCGMLGFPHEPLNHASYVKSWIKHLKDDPYEIISASNAAGKITDFLKSFDPVSIKEMKEAKLLEDAEENAAPDNTETQPTPTTEPAAPAEPVLTEEEARAAKRKQAAIKAAATRKKNKEAAEKRKQAAAKAAETRKRKAEEAEQKARAAQAKKEAEEAEQAALAAEAAAEEARRVAEEMKRKAKEAALNKLKSEVVSPEAPKPEVSEKPTAKAKTKATAKPKATASRPKKSKLVDTEGMTPEEIKKAKRSQAAKRAAATRKANQDAAALAEATRKAEKERKEREQAATPPVPPASPQPRRRRGAMVRKPLSRTAH